MEYQSRVPREYERNSMGGERFGSFEQSRLIPRDRP